MSSTGRRRLTPDTQSGPPRQVIETRDRIGGFLSAEEVIAHTDLSPTRVDGIGERLVVHSDGRHPLVIGRSGASTVTLSERSA